MKRLIVLTAALCWTLSLAAQRISIEEYIETYKDIAMEEMIRTGVPAAIKLAQGIVETESGNSPLVKKSNNHFGIKCKETWTGPWVSHDDDAPKECFRKYNDAWESYKDHSDFLRTRKHYNFLFTLDPADYKAWAHGLKKAGYATNPKYPEMLIKYIETYNLNQYSLLALGRRKQEEPVLVQTPSPATTSPAANSTAAVPEKKERPAPATKPTPVPEKKAAAPVARKEPRQEPVQVVPQPVQPPSPAPVEVVKKPVVNYPAGEFKINETRVVFVKAGTSLLAVAQQYNVPLKYLYDFNDMPERETLGEDQLIYLQRKRRTGANALHQVQPGETLYDIAQAQGIRLEALLQLNQLTGKQMPAVGEQLYLHTPAPVAPRLSVTGNAPAAQQPPVTPSAGAEGDEIVIHLVQSKETLFSIARKYAVAVSDLRKWNGLSGDELREGIELIINKTPYVGHQGSR